MFTPLTKIATVLIFFVRMCTVGSIPTYSKLKKQLRLVSFSKLTAELYHKGVSKKADGVKFRRTILKTIDWVSEIIYGYFLFPP